MTANTWTRRDLVKLAVALGLTPSIGTAAEEKMLSRKIPQFPESELPVIGLGTYNVFDVDGTPAEMAARSEIVELFVRQGGQPDRLVTDVRSLRENHR